jgi:hypothetical protein
MSRQVSYTIEDDTAEKLDRLSRGKKMAPRLRILTRAYVSTPEEMAQWARENEEEAREAQQLVIETFEKLQVFAKMEIGDKAK